MPEKIKEPTRVLNLMIYEEIWLRAYCAAIVAKHKQPVFIADQCLIEYKRKWGLYND